VDEKQPGAFWRRYVRGVVQLRDKIVTTQSTYTGWRKKMKNKKLLKVRYALLTVICALLVSCDAITDQDPGEKDLGTQFLYGPNAAALGSMELSVDSVFISFRKCGWFKDRQLVDGFDYRSNDTQSADLNIGDGAVGDHVGLIHFSRYDYGDGHYKYYSSGKGTGFSAIHVDTNDGRKVEGTFSGRVCNIVNATECLTITDGTFIALNVNE
jgi:hypothetical protein